MGYKLHRQESTFPRNWAALINWNTNPSPLWASQTRLFLLGWSPRSTMLRNPFFKHLICNQNHGCRPDLTSSQDLWDAQVIRWNTPLPCTSPYTTPALKPNWLPFVVGLASANESMNITSAWVSIPVLQLLVARGAWKCWTAYEHFVYTVRLFLLQLRNVERTNRRYHSSKATGPYNSTEINVRSLIVLSSLWFWWRGAHATGYHIKPHRL